ncbi:MAG: HAD family hydrolase [Bryobacteraceae bacterium]|nr:HAD family hydrolase [Bryobacteraceae bacterium]
MSRRAVFLDRDGVLNRPVIRNGKPHPPPSRSEFEIPPETETLLGRLKERGFLLLVVTNQPDVRRGLQSRDEVERMHALLQARLPIDGIFTCYHDDADECECRKPKPGLLRQAASAHGVDVAESYLVGDRWRDVDAGRVAGCRVVWIDYGYRERGPAAEPDARVNSLEAAVAWIAEQDEKRR